MLCNTITVFKKNEGVARVPAYLEMPQNIRIVCYCKNIFNLS